MNHCNVDRAWPAWLANADEPLYVPDRTASDDLSRHRIDDPMFSILTSEDDERWTPRRMLDVAGVYTYDDFDLS
jgi:hypothetical protein